MIRDRIRKIVRGSDGLYPLSSKDERILPNDYKGLIVTSDIDRTYLDTSIHSVRGLVRTALEKAEEKRAYNGMVPLYHAFRNGPTEIPRSTPLYFVSASPPQMEEVLREKMDLDGIEVDGLTFKDQIRLMRKGRWRELKKHIVYKLTALLYSRSRRPKDAQIEEVLIGDDSETDAEAYMLYARILEGSISPTGLSYTLEGLGVQDKEQDTILALASRRDASRVKRIYIHCTTQQKPEQLFQHDPMLFAALDSLQLALDAFAQGWIQRDALSKIARDMGPEATQMSLHNTQERTLFPIDFLEEQKAYILS